MIYLYDKLIVDDLKSSFNLDNVAKPVVSVVSPESIVSIAAQVQDDEISFPLVAVSRSENTPVDTQLTNFTRSHFGIHTDFDKVNNIIYYEKSKPITLSYTLVVMATRREDVDEILKELIFKYESQYFLTLQLPYESNRKIRIGVSLDTDTVEYYSTTSDYLQEGKLYSAGITLKVDGAVLLSYTPVKLRTLQHEIVPIVKGQEKDV